MNNPYPPDVYEEKIVVFLGGSPKGEEIAKFIWDNDLGEWHMVSLTMVNTHDGFSENCQIRFRRRAK